MRMNLDIRLDRPALTQAMAQLRRMGERADNVQAAWNAFLDWFTDNNRRQFGTQGKRWRTPWPELKPGTVADKRRQGWTGDILVRDSTLLRSVSDRPMSLERVGPHDMEGGTRVSYARFHHFGAPRRNIPQRKLWDVAEIAREGAAVSAIRTWILDGDARTGEGRGR